MSNFNVSSIVDILENYMLPCKIIPKENIEIEAKLNLFDNDTFKKTLYKEQEYLAMAIVEPERVVNKGNSKSDLYVIFDGKLPNIENKDIVYAMINDDIEAFDFIFIGHRDIRKVGDLPIKSILGL